MDRAALASERKGLIRGRLYQAGLCSDGRGSVRAGEGRGGAAFDAAHRRRSVLLGMETGGGHRRTQCNRAALGFPERCERPAVILSRRIDAAVEGGREGISHGVVVVVRGRVPSGLCPSPATDQQGDRSEDDGDTDDDTEDQAGNVHAAGHEVIVVVVGGVGGWCAVGGREGDCRGLRVLGGEDVSLSPAGLGDGLLRAGEGEHPVGVVWLGGEREGGPDGKLGVWEGGGRVGFLVCASRLG